MKPFHITFLTLFIFTHSNGQTVHSIKPGKDDKIIYFCEQMPVYPGGNAELVKFVQQHINYPDKAKNDSIQGKVVIRFAVDTDGSVNNVSVVRSISPPLDAEAAKAVKLLARFKPGYSEGKPVKVYFNLPITFSLY